jgi:hypothetical protein
MAESRSTLMNGAFRCVRVQVPKKERPGTGCRRHPTAIRRGGAGGSGVFGPPPPPLLLPLPPSPARLLGSAALRFIATQPGRCCFRGVSPLELPRLAAAAPHCGVRAGCCFAGGRAFREHATAGPRIPVPAGLTSGATCNLIRSGESCGCCVCLLISQLLGSEQLCDAVQVGGGKWQVPRAWRCLHALLRRARQAGGTRACQAHGGRWRLKFGYCLLGQCST